MKMDSITFRSITPAQRAQRLLQKHGIETYLQRTPRWMEERGCGYCLRLRPTHTRRAEQLLQENDAQYTKVYPAEGEGWPL